MKRFVVCMDGTWQNLRNDGSTNIGIIARSVAHRAPAKDGQPPIPQILIYEPGVGSMLNALKNRGTLGAGGDVAGGLFGRGLEDGILNSYLRIAYNYEAGDEIYIFGYSRGAFSARSLAAMIGKCGIVSRRYAEKAQEVFDFYRNKNIAADDPELVRFRYDFGKRVYDAQGKRIHADHRPTITYLGVFDTVGSRGLPSALGPLSDWVNRRFSFHDLKLSSQVLAARHACAIDERRVLFPPTLWENIAELNSKAAAENRGSPYQQRWFAGGHGDVGGGVNSPLSSFSLRWIVEGAEAAGLVMDRTSESPLSETIGIADCTYPLHKLPWTDRIFLTTRRIAALDRDATLEESDMYLDTSVAARSATSRVHYRPKPLKPFYGALAQRAVAVTLTDALVAFLKPPKRKKFLGIF
ncbi:MAG: DUF2235 domain-containing protein [Hyphomonadaceae bacterium]|nr:DUF2235 domain-containing protein [Hyphomonadaceae bacterium]